MKAETVTSVHIPVLVITGGAGFLGKAIMRELSRTDPVITADRIRILDLQPDNPYSDSRVEYRPVDIRRKDELAAALHGADALIHCAAIVDWGTHPREIVFDVNVEGTRNLIESCAEKGVQAMVNISSLDAICTGRPIRNGDESLPYPKRHPNAYCESKAEGEKLIRAADPGRLRACTIRPTGIYGEADPYHISALIDMAEKGPYVRIGSGRAKCQHVYVGNVAHAVLLACAELWKGNPAVAGQEYFITDSPAKNFFGFLDTLVEGSGYAIRPKNLHLPKAFMYVLGVAAELGAFLIRPFKEVNPKVSRFAVKYTCNDFILSGEKAVRELGFSPRYSEEEAYSRTVDYFRANGPARPPRLHF
jgi:nucleoside-diphosphate-sugar epimerase